MRKRTETILFGLAGATIIALSGLLTIDGLMRRHLDGERSARSFRTAPLTMKFSVGGARYYEQIQD